MVDLSEIEGDRESLSSLLCSRLKVNITADGKKLLIDSEDLSSEELKRLVNKFIYRRNLMNKYWVALRGDVIRVEKFKHPKKSGKRKRKVTQPSTIKHGW
jgi:hypothetical protein